MQLLNILPHFECITTVWINIAFLVNDTGPDEHRARYPDWRGSCSTNNGHWLRPLPAADNHCEFLLSVFFRQPEVIECFSFSAIAECFTHHSHRLGVHLSVHWSVRHTLALYQNGASYNQKIFTMGCLKVSSFSWQYFVPLRAEFSLKWVHKWGTLSKKRYFDPIGSSSVKTVADRYAHVAYLNKHWWQAFYRCQRWWPWMTLNSQKRGFSEFFAIFSCDTF